MRIKPKGSDVNTVRCIITRQKGSFIAIYLMELDKDECLVFIRYCIALMPFSLPGRFCLCTVLKRAGCLACTYPFMFCSVITHLYCLCDLVFLPGINHCQQGRGFKNIQGQKGGSSPLTFAPLPVRVEK